MARKKREEEHENHERWLVSYADFITLLFAFFTVLYATSEKNYDEEEKFKKSIERALSNFGVIGGMGSGQVVDPKESIIPPPIQVFRRQNVGGGELEEAVQQLLDQQMQKNKQAQAFRSISSDDLGVRIILDSNKYFNSNGKLNESHLKYLSQLSLILKAAKRKIIIEGHTNLKKNASTAFQESSDKAQKILQYLIEHDRMKPSRLVSVAYGNQKPIASSNDLNEKSKNERMEIVIVTQPNNAFEL